MFTEYIRVQDILKPWGVTEIQFGGWGNGLQKITPLIRLVSVYIFHQIYHILCVSSCLWLRLMCSLWPCWSFRAALKKNQMSTWNYGKCSRVLFLQLQLLQLPRTRPGSQMKGNWKAYRAEVRWISMQLTQVLPLVPPAALCVYPCGSM